MFVKGSRPASQTAAAPAPPLVQVECPEPVHLPRPPVPAQPPPQGALEATLRVPPEYPDEARKANVDGTVIAWLLVCEHGNVVQIQVSKSIPKLDGAAIAALRQWKFRAAMADGHPIPMWTQVPMKFTLN